MSERLAITGDEDDIAASAPGRRRFLAGLLMVAPAHRLTASATDTLPNNDKRFPTAMDTPVNLPLADRVRARDIGIQPGILSPGPLNAITDVPGVMVGHVTLSEGDATRTGVTAIVPHAGNLFQNKVPAGFALGNGFGKFAGSTQVEELGEIETPIVLTNTLSVAEGIAGAVEWTLGQAGNEQVVRQCRGR